MRRRSKILFFALIPLLALSGCATTYQKEGIFANGYSDFRLSQDTFVVSFRANEYTAPEKVMQYALKRASEIALKNGYSHFEIADQIDTSKEHTVIDKQREGNSEKRVFSHLHYPSLRLTIKCFEHKPLDRDAIDARHFLDYN